jgi:hypothetical protein
VEIFSIPISNFRGKTKTIIESGELRHLTSEFLLLALGHIAAAQ